MEAVYKLALSKPYVESIAWGNLADSHTTVPAGGLLDDMLHPKPGFNKLQEMRKHYQQFMRKGGGGTSPTPPPPMPPKPERTD